MGSGQTGVMLRCQGIRFAARFTLQPDGRSVTNMADGIQKVLTCFVPAGGRLTKPGVAVVGAFEQLFHRLWQGRCARLAVLDAAAQVR